MNQNKRNRNDKLPPNKKRMCSTKQKTNVEFEKNIGTHAPLIHDTTRTRSNEETCGVAWLNNIEQASETSHNKKKNKVFILSEFCTFNLFSFD